MSDRRGVPPAPRVIQKIPIVAWSSAPPPVPPRTFSTEPPPASRPPSEPTLVRQDPIDARALLVGDPRRADEVRDEARGMVHQALEEALAPLHFRVNELERRIEAYERNARAPVAPLPPSPSVALRAAAAAPRALMSSAAFVPLAPAFAPIASPVIPPAPLAPAPMETAFVPSPTYVPADPFASAASFPRPAAISTFDRDLPFDGARRKRNVLLFFALLFVLVVGGLLGSMAMSYSSPH